MKESKQSQTPIEDLQELRNYFASHNTVREYIAHNSKVHSVGWSCDGKRLASGSFDKSVAIFTLDRTRLVSIILIHQQKYVNNIFRLYLCLQFDSIYSGLGAPGQVQLLCNDNAL